MDSTTAERIASSQAAQRDAFPTSKPPRKTRTPFAMYHRRCDPYTQSNAHHESTARIGLRREISATRDTAADLTIRHRARTQAFGFITVASCRHQSSARRGVRGHHSNYGNEQGGAATDASATMQRPWAQPTVRLLGRRSAQNARTVGGDGKRWEKKQAVTVPARREGHRWHVSNLKCSRHALCAHSPASTKRERKEARIS